MLLRDLMWEVFQSTGQIEAYLIYRSCIESNDQQIVSSDHNGMVAPLH